MVKKKEMDRTIIAVEQKKEKLDLLQKKQLNGDNYTMEFKIRLGNQKKDPQKMQHSKLRYQKNLLMIIYYKSSNTNFLFSSNYLGLNVQTL